MKWAVIILLILGVLAALFTAVLVGTLRNDPDNTANGVAQKIKVVLAKKDLPAMSVVGSDDVYADSILKKDIPSGCLFEPVQAIGNVLAVPVVKGQILTTHGFVVKGSKSQLAAAIPKGMRAITVVLSESGVTGGLLYPGCIVDVLASFRLDGNDRDKGQALSTTLLQGIQVLAVEDVSVVSRDEIKQEFMTTRRSANSKMTVSLMVNPRQAEALQLARTYGTLSMSMRNPLDRDPMDSDTTVLSQGQLAKYGSVLTPAVLTTDQKQAFVDEIKKQANDKRPRSKRKSLPDTEASIPDTIESNFGEKPPVWAITVIRGSQVQEVQVDIPREETGTWITLKR
jgi:pilus assembly protein CpaB